MSPQVGVYVMGTKLSILLSNCFLGDAILAVGIRMLYGDQNSQKPAPPTPLFFEFFPTNSWNGEFFPDQEYRRMMAEAATVLPAP